jgi:hypothetical protein
MAHAISTLIIFPLDQINRMHPIGFLKTNFRGRLSYVPDNYAIMNQLLQAKTRANGQFTLMVRWLLTFKLVWWYLGFQFVVIV